MKWLGVIAGVLMASHIAAAGEQSAAEDDKASENKPKDPIEVYARKITQKEIYDPMVFGGFVEAGASAEISAETAGRVTNLLVREGTQVRAGAELAAIMPFSGGLDFKEQRLTSPIAGIVTRVLIKPGQSVAAGATLIEVDDPSHLRTTIQITYSDLSHISKTTPAEAVIGSGTPGEWKTAAIIQSIAPKADIRTGTFAMTMALECPGDTSECMRRMPLGSMVRMVIKKNKRTGYMVRLSHLQNNRTKVLAVDGDNKARWMDVSLGAYFGEEVEITSGIKSDLMLVTSYAERPDEGDALKIIPEETPEKPAISGKDSKTPQG